MSENISETMLLAERQINQLPIGIGLVDSKFQILSWNDTLARWLQMPAEEFIGKNLIEIFPHLKGVRFINRLHGVFERGQPALFSPSASQPFLPIALDPTTEGNAMLQKVVIAPLESQTDIAQICVTDVTAQYNQIRALRKEKEEHQVSRAKTHAILKSAADAILTVTGEGTIESLNTAAQSLFGYDEGELIGASIAKLLTSLPETDSREEFTRQIRAIKNADDEGRRELVGQRKDASIVPVLLSVGEIEIDSGQPSESGLFTFIVRDLTVQKRRHQELREAIQRAEALGAFGQILDRSLNEIYIIDAETLTFTHVNKGAQENIGYTMEELRSMTPLDFVTGSTAEEFSAILRPLKESVGAGVEVVREHRRKDGTKYPVQVYLESAVLMDRPVIVAVVLDITERLRVETQLREAADRALAADRSKSEFLTNMSHEIRTPMTAILGFNEILLERVTAQEEVDAAETVRKNGEYLLDLINDILDLSKIESGKVEIEQIPVSPHELVRDVTSLMSVRSKAKGIELRTSFRGKIPERIVTDLTRLRQILVNIVGNAIKFTETGSVEIVTTFTGSNTNDPQLQFEVIDTGIGISESKFEQLFQPFTQADSSTTRQFGGTGLGLAISKRMAALLGGSLTVTSELGMGSTFTISVSAGPIDEVRLIDEHQFCVAKPDESKEDSNNMRSLEGCRVLLAEDGPDNQRLFGFVLSRAGALVTTADDGQAAYDLVTSGEESGQSFDVILMDMQMPILDGYQATAKLREQGVETPILALTAHAMSHDRARCLDAGCDEYLTKPIDRKQFVATVASFYRKSTRSLST